MAMVFVPHRKLSPTDCRAGVDNTRDDQKQAEPSGWQQANTNEQIIPLNIAEMDE